MDHGKILSLGTPEELKQSVGADTIVTVTADGDLETLGARLSETVDGVDSSTVRDGSVQLAVRGADGVLIRVISRGGGGAAIRCATCWSRRRRSRRCSST